MKGIVWEDGRYRPLNGGYAARFSERFGVEVCNRSHFGYTVRKGAVLLQRMLERGGGDGDIVLLEYGGNDCDFDWEAVAADPQGRHNPKTTPEEFCELYGRLVSMLQSRGMRVALMTLPPIDAQRYLGWVAPEEHKRRSVLRWLGDSQVIYRFQEMYSGLAAKVAAQTGALLADIRPAFLTQHDMGSLLCRDGIHPNAAGHALIFDTLCEIAQSNL